LATSSYFKQIGKLNGHGALFGFFGRDDDAIQKAIKHGAGNNTAFLLLLLVAACLGFVPSRSWQITSCFMLLPHLCIHDNSEYSFNTRWLLLMLCCCRLSQGMFTWMTTFRTCLTLKQLGAALIISYHHVTDHYILTSLRIVIMVLSYCLLTDDINRKLYSDRRCCCAPVHTVCGRAPQVD
jgi:hypothetical protein